ncbi:MAG: hypothetical protein ACI8WB_003793 [Phenylobacterium sp.]|jgi:hypothetical protein
MFHYLLERLSRGKSNLSTFHNHVVVVALSGNDDLNTETNVSA